MITTHGIGIEGVEMLDRCLENTLPPGALLLCLRFLKTGLSLSDLAQEAQLDRKTYASRLWRYLPRVSEKCYEVLVAGRTYVPTEEEQLVTKCLFGASVIGSIDSFPIPTDGAEYNPHYAAKIKKGLCAVYSNGTVAMVDGPFAGTAYDDTLLRGTSWGPPEGTILLGDGHFSAPWILNPKKKGELVRDHMVGDEQGREAMIFNERVGYVRAEVEHMFGRSKFGSFVRLSSWKFDHAMLRPALRLVAAAVNANVLGEHPEGRVRMPKQWLQWMHIETAAPKTTRYDDVPEIARQKLKKLKDEAAKPPSPKKASSSKASEKERVSSAKKSASASRLYEKKVKELDKVHRK